MQTVNNLIFDSTNAADGKWQDVSNMVQFSIHVVNLEGKVWIEASNDPNVKTDGASSLTAPAPVLSQFAYGALKNQGTADIKITYVTKAGETVPGTNATLAVDDNNVLVVASPAQDAGGLAIGYNVYAKIGSTYILQNTGTSGAGPYAGAGAIPIGTAFQLAYGVYNSGAPAPAANTAGSVGAGVNVVPILSPDTTGNLVSYATGPKQIDGPVAVFGDTGNGGSAIWSPSSMTWKYIRVRKDNTTQTKETKAWLAGAMG